MDWIGVKTKLKEFVGRYKFAALVLVLGLLFMLVPSRKNESKPDQIPSQPTELQQTEETRLEEILMQIDGAGKVRVMLTQAMGAETVYQTDDDSSNNGESRSLRQDTVTVTDSERAQNGLIRQINPPVYLGAVVVCQGADRASVRLAIIEAVSKVTNLGSDQISVLKMK